MEDFLELEVSKKLNDKLTNISVSTQALDSFKIFKTKFAWLAKEFDQQISNFYLHEVFNKAQNIKLTEILATEVSLYFWVKARGINNLKQHWVETYDKLKKLRSPFAPYFQFYQVKLKDRTQNHNLIFVNFLERWEALIVDRIVNYKLHETLLMRQKYVAMWTNNFKIIGQVKNLIAFAWNFFGHFWEGDLNDFKKVNLNTILKYASLLENNPAIIELTRKLGRAIGQSDKYETKIEDHIVIEYEPLPIGKWPEEVVGVTSGRDLEHLLPLELANLAIPALKPIFYKRFIEDKLSILEFESVDLVAKEVVQKRKVKTNIPLEQGPIILCIDTSKSMKGSPEIIAKSIALAITKTALEQNRSCYMINFSGIFETYDLSSIKASLPNLIHFLGHSFLGQTNISPVFNHVLDVMQTDKYRNADLLVISDFLSSNLTDEQINKMKDLQDDRNRFHGINIAPIDLKNNWKNHLTTYYNYDPRDPWAVRKTILNINKKWKKME